MNLPIIITVAFLLQLVSSNELVTCKKVHDAFNVCKRNGVLVFVNETINEAGLEIVDPNLSEIAPNAFQDLSIAELKLDVKGNPVTLQPASFEGLSSVDTVVIHSATFSPQSNLFKALTSLTSLTITSSKISELSSGTFAGLSRLMNLYLNYNNIITIAANTFDSSLSNVLNLWLNNNELSVIEPDAFRVFSKLQRLHLNNNKLTTLKPGIFNGLTELKHLFLAHNQLTSIPKNVFNHMTPLQSLDLSYNKISSIESGAFEGLVLHTLNLRNNELSAISSGIFTDVKTRALNLAHNHISRVDSNAFNNSLVGAILLKDNSVTIDKKSWGLPDAVEVSLDDD